MKLLYLLLCCSDVWSSCCPSVCHSDLRRAYRAPEAQQHIDIKEVQPARGHQREQAGDAYQAAAEQQNTQGRKHFDAPEGRTEITQNSLVGGGKALLGVVTGREEEGLR
jgi:hypothetical protein